MNTQKFSRQCFRENWATRRAKPTGIDADLGSQLATINRWKSMITVLVHLRTKSGIEDWFDNATWKEPGSIESITAMFDVYRCNTYDRWKYIDNFSRKLRSFCWFSQEQFCEHPRLAFNCSLANIIKPLDGWPDNVIDEFKRSLTTTFLYAKINNYNPIRYLCEVELRDRSSQMTMNEDFSRLSLDESPNDTLDFPFAILEHYQQAESLVPLNDALIYRSESTPT